MTARPSDRGWTLTLGLSALALVAALLAPRLTSAGAVEPEAPLESEADLCVRLGSYECCYAPVDP
jgi:hypothetical protein